ncbi:MAG: DUF2877 domain-containing protein [Thermoanaerobaculia bacterium]
MRGVEVTALLEQVAARPPERAPLPCRELEPAAGPVSRASLVLDLACILLPARTRALLSGGVGEAGSVDALVLRWAHARLFALAAALVSGEIRVGAYRPDAGALTGLGPGLTPTGDDLLVGLAAMAVRLAAGGLVDPRSVAAYSAALSLLPAEETTTAAAHLVRNASHGHFPAVLAAAVETIGNPHAATESLRAVTGRLTATGAHSGADLLAGALALVHGVVDARETR